MSDAIAIDLHSLGCLPDTGAHERVRLAKLATPTNAHHWRVEALYDGRFHAQPEYEGHEYRVMCQTVGALCLEITVDKIFVWRDGEKYRHIEVR